MGIGRLVTTRSVSKAHNITTRSVSEGHNITTRSVSEGHNITTRSVSEGHNITTRSVSEGHNCSPSHMLRAVNPAALRSKIILADDSGGQANANRR